MRAKKGFLSIKDWHSLTQKDNNVHFPSYDSFACIQYSTAIQVMYAESMSIVNPRSDFNFTLSMIASPEVAHRSQGTSLRSFLASLTFSALVLSAETLLFFLLKDRITQL